MNAKFAKAAGVAIGSGVLAVAPTVSEAIIILEPEPNTPPAGANVPVANTFDTIQGSVNDDLPDLDSFNYQGLTPGSSFDVFVELFGTFSRHVNAEARDGLGNLVPGPGSTLALDLDIPLGSGHLFGTVPATGLSVRLSTGSEGPEGYRITLQQISVPLPASIALLAAGLVGVGGLHVARRKRAA